MKTITLPSLLGLLILAAPVFAQDTLFFAGFEGFDEIPFVIEPADLNADSKLIGEWSGEEFPEGQGDILILPDSVGILPSPYGGNLLLLDRPSGDFDGNDLTGSFFANLTQAAPLLGSEVSFQVGTRRTGGDEAKSYSIIGRDESGEESFHIRVSANNNGGERLGYVAGGETVFDLPTVIGEDKANDLDNTGGFNIDNGPGLGAEIANVLVRLGRDGYVIDFSYPEENTSSNANAYVTALLPYNGAATQLSQLEFTYEASTANGRNSGYILDEILVTTFGDITIGDFNSDGNIDIGDFQILQANFEEGTTFPEGDMNFDGQVNLKDFIELKAAFAAGQAAGAAAVPEPAGGLLCIFGAAMLLALLRRRCS